MQLRKMYDLAYGIDTEGDVHIEQDAGAGEVDRVLLHPMHVRLIASELGLLKGEEGAWRRVETLERRLTVLRDRIETLNGALFAEPIYPAGDPRRDPNVIYSEATLEIAEEFCADLPFLTAGADGAADTEPDANPRATRGQPMGSQMQIGEGR